jgi:hypothetical protein
MLVLKFIDLRCNLKSTKKNKFFLKRFERARTQKVRAWNSLLLLVQDIHYLREFRLQK